MTGTVNCPEFSLLSSCCQSNVARAGQGKTADVAAAIDWDHFLTLARFHRVEGLAWGGIKQHAGVPKAVTNILAAEARLISAENLAITGECIELRDSFADADIPLLFVKGLTIAALAYRSPMLKRSRDIDLLVAEVDLERAAGLLERHGYALVLPADRRNLARWHCRSKESVWSRDGSFHVELHTRLADNRRLIPAINVQSPRQTVEVAPGVALPTLGPDELFAYLCVHGASSAWFRLKWIADLAGLVGRLDASELERTFRRSLQLGAGRTAAQALLLIDRLFGPLANEALRQELLASRRNRWLGRLALDQLAAATEPTDTRLGTWRIHLNQLAMGGGAGFALRDAWRQANDALLLRRFTAMS